MSTIERGIVKTWNATRGFGFIHADDDGCDIFAHATGLIDVEELERGDQVAFQRIQTDRGARAVSVRVV